MTYQHHDLAGGRWVKFSLAEQMAHIGSEVARAIRWRKKGNREYARLAFERALELCDLTLHQPYPEPTLRELTRLRETLVDDFAGDNRYGSTDQTWQRYFSAFTYAALQMRS